MTAMSVPAITKSSHYSIKTTRCTQKLYKCTRAPVVGAIAVGGRRVDIVINEPEEPRVIA